MRGLSALERKLIDGDQFDGPIDYTDHEFAALEGLFVRGLISKWYCEECEGSHFDLTPMGATILTIVKASP